MLEKFYPSRSGPEDHADHSLGTQQLEIGLETSRIINNDVPFTVGEVNIVVNALRKDVAPGPDGIKTTFFQTIYKAHTGFFLNLFNACLEQGYFPKWKQSKIVLIPKSKAEDKIEEKKYRPIAINSILGKVLEKLLKDRIYYFLVKNKLLQEYQFGFTHNTSTIEALQELKRRISRAKLDKLNIAVISLDIKDAFNSILPSIVTDRLVKYKCPNNLIKITDNSLRNREIIYQDEGVRVIKPILAGSPQGSPLSPLYWNLTIADLLEKKLGGGIHVQVFADDIVILVEFKARKEAVEKVNKVIKVIYNWAQDARIVFNKDKSEYMIIGKQYGSRPPIIQVGSDKVRIVNEMRILGVIFDNKLTFTSHLKYLKQKVMEITYNLNRTMKLDKNTSNRVLSLIYKRGIERMITYASQVWYTRRVVIVRKLTSIQRLPLIMLTKAFETTSNISLNVLAKIPPIYLAIEKESEVYNIMKGNKDLVWNDKTFTGNEVMRKYDLWQHHPAQRAVVTVGVEEEQVDFWVFTDGSKNEKDVGAAFVIFDKENKIIIKRKFKLPEYSSNYEAEVVAIKEAIEFLLVNFPYQVHQLCTDSLSALQALKNPTNTNPLINEIKNLLFQNKSFILKFIHVKAHGNSFGNNTADELAKEAATNGETPLFR